MQRIIRVMKVGKLRYGVGLQLQKYIIQLIKESKCDNNFKDLHGILILTEHYPVYTVGIRNKNYDSNYEKKLLKLGAEFFKTDRGGLVTFHGLGQLISYPILNLKRFQPSVRWYVSQLEKTVILTCKEFGLDAYTSPHTGVWVNDKKICAMGIRASQQITSHGLALNCDIDLNWFKHIIPCGIENKGITSLTEECARKVSVEYTINYFLKSFSIQFDCILEDYSEDFIQNALMQIKSN